MIRTTTLLLFAVALVGQANDDVVERPTATIAMRHGDYPAFYHTSDELRDAVIAMTKGDACPGLAHEVRTHQGTDVKLDMFTLRKPGATPKHKVTILFGEHSRELITVETGFAIIKSLCGQSEGFELSGQKDVFGDVGPKAKTVLEESEFQIFLNSNPESRKMVEKGDFCRRYNPNEVDINRNWDSGWSSVNTNGDTAPGSRAFSEPESNILRDAIAEFKPTTFLSIHSGNTGMFTPYAYKHIQENKLVTQTGPIRDMYEILKDVDVKYCRCPFGQASSYDNAGYVAPGTSFDYVYENIGAKYAMAFEIYLGDSDTVESRHDIFERELLNLKEKESKWEALELKVSGKMSSIVEASNDDDGLVRAKRKRNKVVGARRNKQSRSESLVSSVTGEHTPHHAHPSHSRVGHSDFRGPGFPEALIQLKGGNWCLGHFNPVKEAEFKHIRAKWTHALLDVIHGAAEKDRNQAPDIVKVSSSSQVQLELDSDPATKVKEESPEIVVAKSVLAQTTVHRAIFGRLWKYVVWCFVVMALFAGVTFLAVFAKQQVKQNEHKDRNKRYYVRKGPGEAVPPTSEPEAVYEVQD